MSRLLFNCRSCFLNDFFNYRCCFLNDFFSCRLFFGNYCRLICSEDNFFRFFVHEVEVFDCRFLCRCFLNYRCCFLNNFFNCRCFLCNYCRCSCLCCLDYFRISSGDLIYRFFRCEYKVLIYA